jgi:hypothetical protein
LSGWLIQNHAATPATMRMARAIRRRLSMAAR